MRELPAATGKLLEMKSSILRYIVNTNKGGVLMQYCLLSRRVECSFEEKMEALKLIGIILNIRDKAAENGILSLEEYINDESLPFLLRRGIQNDMDGLEFEICKKILNYYIESGHYFGIELLLRLICMEASLLLREGYGSITTQSILIAMLGEDFYDIAIGYLDNRKK
jgi:hypothetical protein